MRGEKNINNTRHSVLDAESLASNELADPRFREDDVNNTRCSVLDAESLITNLLTNSHFYGNIKENVNE